MRSQVAHRHAEELACLDVTRRAGGDELLPLLLQRREARAIDLLGGHLDLPRLGLGQQARERLLAAALEEELHERQRHGPPQLTAGGAEGRQREVSQFRGGVGRVADVKSPSLEQDAELGARGQRHAEQQGHGTFEGLGR